MSSPFSVKETSAGTRAGAPRRRCGESGDKLVQGRKGFAVKGGRLGEEDDRRGDGQDQGEEFFPEPAHFLPGAEPPAAQHVLQGAGIDGHADLAAGRQGKDIARVLLGPALHEALSGGALSRLGVLMLQLPVQKGEGLEIEAVLPLCGFAEHFLERRAADLHGQDQVAGQRDIALRFFGIGGQAEPFDLLKGQP